MAANEESQGTLAQGKKAQSRRGRLDVDATEVAGTFRRAKLSIESESEVFHPSRLAAILACFSASCLASASARFLGSPRHILAPEFRLDI